MFNVTGLSIVSCTMHFITNNVFMKMVYLPYNKLNNRQIVNGVSFYEKKFDFQVVTIILDLAIYLP